MILFYFYEGFRSNFANWGHNLTKNLANCRVFLEIVEQTHWVSILQNHITLWSSNKKKSFLIGSIIGLFSSTLEGAKRPLRDLLPFFSSYPNESNFKEDEVSRAHYQISINIRKWEKWEAVCFHLKVLFIAIEIIFSLTCSLKCIQVCFSMFPFYW